MEIWTPSEAQKIVDAAGLLSRAQVFEGTTQAPREFQIFKFIQDPLGLARPNALAISFPFRSIYFQEASFLSQKVYIVPQSLDFEQDRVTLRPGSAIDFGKPVSKAYIYYDGLPALPADAFVELLFSTSSSIKAGNLDRGVKTDMYGLAFTRQVILTAATAKNLDDPLTIGFPPIITSDGATGFVAGVLDRQLLLQNNTGANLFVGPNFGATQSIDDGSQNIGGPLNLGQTMGQIVPPGAGFTWNNKTPLWAYSTAGGFITVIYEMF